MDTEKKELIEEELNQVSGGDLPPGTRTVYITCPNCGAGLYYPEFMYENPNVTMIGCPICKNNYPKNQW